MKPQRSSPKHVMERDWASIRLGMLADRAEEVEERIAECRADAKIAGKRPDQSWVKGRLLARRARRAAAHLARLYNVDLACTDLPSGEGMPLWLLAGESNPLRRRAEALRAQLDADLAAVEKILSCVTKKDELRLIERRLDAEDLAEQQAAEMPHRIARRLDRTRRSGGVA